MKSKLLIILLIAGWITAIAMYVGYKAKTFHLQQVNEVIQARADTLSHYKDKYGTEHAQRLAIESSYTVLKNYYNGLLDSISQRAGVKQKNIKAVATTGVETGGAVALRVDTIYRSDTTQSYQFSYVDRWIDITGDIGEQNKLTYKTFDSIVLTTYAKPSGFLGLGEKHTYVDGYSLNPHSHITGLQSMLLTSERDKKFGIGVQAGYGWNGLKWAPYFGFGIQYSIIRF